MEGEEMMQTIETHFLWPSRSLQQWNAYAAALEVCSTAVQTETQPPFLDVKTFQHQATVQHRICISKTLSSLQP
ncbi:hypothetical protein LDENG_00053310 [Lucifuga dentata]|nr:hypothetical protein LDENG_00053310 [Lucifuga dentata]